MFDEKGVFYYSDITTLEPHIRAILEPQGIKSILHCAIMDSGEFRGYIGFDDCTLNRHWTQEQVELLKFLAETLVVFLLKKRKQDQMEAQTESLRNILDLQDDWLYVIDPNSCEIKFLNAKSHQITSDDVTGVPCYCAFMKRSERCENCPALGLGHGESRSVRVDNWISGGSIVSRATQIDWNGESAVLLTCREVNPKG